MTPVDPKQGQNKQNRPDGDKPDTVWPRWSIWVIGLMLLSIVLFSLFGRTETGTELDTSQFLSDLKAGPVVEVTIDNTSGKATGERKISNGTETFTTTVNPGDELDTALAAAEAEHDTKYTYESPSPNVIVNLLVFILPFALLILLFVWISRRSQGQMGSIMQIGKSRAKVYTTEKPKTTFGDVAGHNGPKQEIKEVVTFLKEPRKFKELGAKVPKGVLLVGPPGTGKTLLARAVAGEAGVPFIAVTGSDFMEMFVGVGAARVRDLFQTARKQSPAVIFIDEIDSIGRKRGAGLGGGHDEREQTLNQLLSEMDGFEGAEGIVMMAATNRPDILDPALLRPGRFDRQIIVPLPTQTERLEILKVHTKDKKIAPDVDLVRLSRGTPGFSGADLANLTNEGALHAVRASHTLIMNEDLDSARDRIIMGIKRDSLVMSPEEKRVTAYHEAGHALCGALSEHSDDIHKVTILPVGMALGVTQFLPDERNMESRERIEARLVVMMGGRVAEDVVFGSVTTGAQNDLQQATKLARMMVKEWGMSDKLGPVAYGGDNGMVFLGDEISRGHEYSEQTARLIDEEVAHIVNHAMRHATHLLTEHRAGLDLVAQALLDREQIEGEEVHRLLRVSLGQEPPLPAAAAAIAGAPEEQVAALAPAPQAQETPKGWLPPAMPGMAH